MKAVSRLHIDYEKTIYIDTDNPSGTGSLFF